MAIIGIISAIAIPQFTANKNEAAKVAMNTSAGNVAKAFKHCLALKSFGECKSLSAIKITCPAGADCAGGGTSPNFCAHIHKGKTGSEFEVCVQINATTGAEIRKYDGGLVGNICHLKETSAGGCSARNSGSKFALDGPKSCTTAAADCPANVTADAANDVCAKAYTCEPSIDAADCNSTTGVCS